jgi:nitrogen fixation-related uncharacterized protein
MIQSSDAQFRWRSFLFHALAVAFFLVPAGIGFTVKYLDLLILFGSGEEGAFAIMPVMNYLLCSLGFFMLFFWAVRHGMFRDIEQVKHKMLETEAKLDAAEEEETEAQG